MNELNKIYQQSSDPAHFASKYFQYLGRVINTLDTEAIGRFLELLLESRERGSLVYFIGNGGSASTANHFANDVLIGPRDWKKPVRGVSLTSNPAITTAIANDFGYEEIFVKQLEPLLKPEDVVVAISVSGNSANIVRGIEYAKKCGATTVGLTGFDGGALGKLADVHIHVPTNHGEYGPAEDVHMILCHFVNSYLIQYMGSQDEVKRVPFATETIPVSMLDEPDRL